MLLDEWKLEDALVVEREEGREEGIEEGWEKAQEAIFTLWQQGYTLDEAKQILAKSETQTVTLTAGK